MHAYEVRPRNDHRDVDLIGDALPFGRLWYLDTGSSRVATEESRHYNLCCAEEP
jgi:hypothetical protein